MNILVTGGCGYVGTVLVNYLLDNGNQVSVVDTQWFGNYLEPHQNLILHKIDIRDIDTINFEEIETIIHLGNIANDPSVELNPILSWEVNCLGTEQLLDRASRNGIKNFIFASSGSVYGIKDEEKVTEDLSLVPISIYNKTKMVAERIALSYQEKMNVYCIRPATVCGYSPRMRLDLSVNMLTIQALVNNKITVFGGNQIRPNIHIKDMISVYDHFLNNADKIQSGCYNAGFENISILDIAKKVQQKIDSEIIITESNDDRSYRQHSGKLIDTGYIQKYSVDYAIDEIIYKYNDGQLKNLDKYYNIKTMKSLFNN